MTMDFSDDSLARRRSIRMEEVARMEEMALFCKSSLDHVLVLDTGNNCSTSSSNNNSSNSLAPPSLRRSKTESSVSSNNSESSLRRPSDIEIRSLWRMRVNQLKLDDVSTHSSSS